MIPIKDDYKKFGTDPTMEEQLRRTNNWIYKTKKSILDRPSGPVAQRIEALGLYGSRCELSNPTQAGQRFTCSKTWCDRQQLWKAVITGDTVTRLSIPDKFYDFTWYLVNFETVYYPALQEHI